MIGDCEIDIGIVSEKQVGSISYGRKNCISEW